MVNSRFPNTTHDIDEVIKELKYLHDVKRWVPSEPEERVAARRNITNNAIVLLTTMELCEDAVSRKAAVEIAEGYGLRNGSALGHHAGIADIIAEQIDKLPSVTLLKKLE